MSNGCRRLLLLALVLAGAIAAAPPNSGASTIAETQSGQAASSISGPQAGSTSTSSGASTSSPPSTTPKIPEIEIPEIEAPETASTTSTTPTTPPPTVVSEVPQPAGATPKRRSPRAHAKRQPAAAGETGRATSGTPSPSHPAGAPTLAPNPSAFEPLIPSPALMPPGASPVLSFFIDSYRTPPFLLPIYLAAAERYDVPWQVLAAINEVESDYGYDLSVSSAGAEGWMQFLPEEWSAYGVDANGAGVRDPYNPADAIFAAARYLQAAGAAHDLRAAIYAYNHSSSYVESVLLRARLLGETPQSMIGGLAAIVDGRMPVEDAGGLTATPAWTTVAAVPRARALRPTVVGANIATTRGAPVLAVQSAEVIHIGRSAKLGRFIELRDAYGDVYTYARLGRVLKRYKLPPQPRRGGSAAAPNGRAALSTGMRLAPLRRGAWVVPGTVLGNVVGSSHGTRARFLFEVQPAGAGPIDPRPLLDAWRLLGEAQGHPRRGTQPLFGPSARDALIDEILLMSKRQLKARLLSDPALRRTISALDGVPIRGNHAPGLLAKLAATPLSSSAARPGPVLGTAQWPKLIARISRLPQPHVPRRPTSAALADTPSSPAPAASPLGWLPPALSGSASPGQAGPAAAAPSAQPSSGGGPPDLNSPFAGPTGPLAALLAPASSQSEPAVTLETEPAGPDFISESLVTLKLNTTLASEAIESIVFEIRPEETTTWQEVEGTKSPTQPYAFLRPEEEVAQDGPYELRVVVTEKATHTQYESPPIERLIVVGESPVVKLAVPESPLRGVIKLQAEVPYGAEIQPIRFEWAPAGSGAWRPVPTAPSGSEPTSCAGTATTACFDTATSEAPNGRDDFRVVPAGGEGLSFVSLPVRGRLVDNTPPKVGKVELEPPGSPLSGDVTLKATANDPRLPNGEPGSGVASVTFERARAGSAAWARLPGGEVTVPSSSSAGTYAHRLHTEILENGRYRLRARALDAAGNQASLARKRKSKSPTRCRRPRSRHRSPAWWRPPKTSRSSAPSPPAQARCTKRKPGPTASRARHPRRRARAGSNTRPKATSSCCCAMRKRAAGRSPTCRAKPAASSRSSCWRPMSSTSTRAAGSR